MATASEPMTAEPGEDFDQEIKALLEPTGFRILVRIPRLNEQMRSGLFRPAENRAAEEVAQLTGRVVALGRDAYQDENRFPSGPYCKEGDTVLFRAYVGTHFEVRGAHYRLLNDDTVQAVIAGDPDLIERA